jgi:hypothetical protein
MTNENFALQQLVNTHKVAAIIMPLIEAVEINKRSGGIKNLQVKDLLKQVIETGSEIYQALLDEENLVVDTGLVSDKLFVSLAMSLRNSVVLYSNASLALMKDEMISVFKAHSTFIQEYQNDFVLGKSVNGMSDPEKVSEHAKKEALNYILPALSKIYMPIYLFHTNLYTSGFVDAVKVAKLNHETFGYITDVLSAMVRRVSSSQGENDNYFKESSLVMCSDLITHVLRDYHRKLANNEKTLRAYIASPLAELEKLVPVLYANFQLLNSESERALTSILGENWRQS